jgi:hypothetical protein
VRGGGQLSGTAWFVEWQVAGIRRVLELTGRLTVGRSKGMDVVVDDPYVSREHCVLEIDGSGSVRVDATCGSNVVTVDGRDLKLAVMRGTSSFSIGRTLIQLRQGGGAEDSTLHMSQARPTLTFRRSTRELFAPDGTLVAQLAPLEGSALETIAARFPDAADHVTLSLALWGEPDHERYLIHRMVQRLRDRLGDYGDLIENVRGAGYRLKGPIDLR